MKYVEGSFPRLLSGHRSIPSGFHRVSIGFPLGFHQDYHDYCNFIWLYSGVFISDLFERTMHYDAYRSFRIFPFSNGIARLYLVFTSSHRTEKKTTNNWSVGPRPLDLIVILFSEISKIRRWKQTHQPMDEQTDEQKDGETLSSLSYS